MTGKKVLVRTLNVFNGNYGGVLQAYALQQAIAALGHEPWTDESRPVALAGRVKRALKPHVRLLPARYVPLRLAAPVVNARLEDFVRRNLQLVDLYQGRRSPAEADVRRFDAFVVGSDQVWRHDYADVPSYLLDFTVGMSVPRVAYAASFGTSGLDGYRPDLVRRTTFLAQQLTAVSVREDTAVTLCHDRWGVQATHVLDPTMLLTSDHYRSVIDRCLLPEIPEPFLYSFTLDDSLDKQALVRSVAHRMGVDVRRALPAPVPSFAEVRRRPETYQKPPVEEWLRGFAEAEVVITDSFHGTVLSILFEKPFLTIVNPSRGRARFTSLLTAFGLMDHLVEPGTGTVDVPTVDWSAVREVLEPWRAQSRSFLAGALNPGG